MSQDFDSGVLSERSPVPKRRNTPSSGWQGGRRGYRANRGRGASATIVSLGPRAAYAFWQLPPIPPAATGWGAIEPLAQDHFWRDAIKRARL